MRRTVRAPVLTALGASLLAACGPTEEPASEARPAQAPTPTPVEARAPAPDLRTAPAYMAVSDVLRSDDSFATAKGLAELLPTLTPEAIPAVEKLLEDARIGIVEIQPAEALLLVRFWASHDAEGAARWAVRASPTEFHFAAVLATLENWAEVDNEAARAAIDEWMRTRPDLREWLQIALVRGWFRADPEALAKYIRDRDSGIRRQRMVSAYVRLLVRERGTEAAMRWAEGVPDDDRTYKLAVYRQVALALPLFDKDAALRWCQAHCDGPFGDSLRVMVARMWGQIDAPAALAWLSGVPEGQERDLGVRVVWAKWGRDHPEDAVAWMEAQTRGDSRSAPQWIRPTFPIYVRVLVHRKSPEEAIAWAERIEDDEEREKVLVQAVRAWRSKDEEAAQAWLAKAPLSDAARERASTSKPAPTI